LPRTDRNRTEGLTAAKPPPHTEAEIKAQALQAAIDRQIDKYMELKSGGPLNPIDAFESGRHSQRLAREQLSRALF
jgi:hypothetical protein